MEHSLLHALQLCSIVIALGGAFLMLAILLPVAGRASARAAFTTEFSNSITRWTILGALLGALATFFNLFVDVAEFNNRTLFGGVDFHEVWRFVTVTTVGRLTLARLAALLLGAASLKLPGKARWWLAALFALTAAVLNSLVCHAAAQPTGRASAFAIQITHTLAAALWLGPLIHLLLARKHIEAIQSDDSRDFLARTVRRFSPIALVAVALIFISGVIAAARFLLSPAAVPTSAYGLTLVVKLLLTLLLLYAGWMNYRVIQPLLLACSSGVPPSGGSNRLKPELQTDSSCRALLQRFTRLLELEVTAGVLVIAVAGILASISPPSDGAALRLTHGQLSALLTPHLPTTALVDPQKFVGAVERTVDDLRYSEFMHNWSGVIVIWLGIFWLMQSLCGRAGAWAEKLWPLVMIPFAGFIAYAADPEVWILHTMSLAQVFADPIMLEHQVGALLVLMLVWLGWRDRHKPAVTRPLGYALPVLLAGGSLLLLGHAHSALTATQELTNLINVQHAVFGALGLFAGVVRWLQLRGLFPDRGARIAWPGLVIALGLFMAFFYREVV